MLVAGCQLLEQPGDIEANSRSLVSAASIAAGAGATIICFPEAYLQGYVVDEKLTAPLALSVDSSPIKQLCRALEDIEATIVTGFIEKAGDDIYNSALVIRRGQVLGTYRKSYLLPGEKRVFAAGQDYPIFEADGLIFGVNICFDLQFAEAAAGVAGQGATLLVCPCNNMLRTHTAEDFKHKHNAIRADRCRETGLWLLSADVTGARDGRISYGPTAVIDPAGHVVAQAPLNVEGSVTHTISA